MSKPIYSVDVYLYVHTCFPHADAEWWGGMRRQLSCLVGNTYVICAQVKTRARSDRSGRARCFVFALHHFHVDGSRKRQKGAHLISFHYAHHIYCILYSKYLWFYNDVILVFLLVFLFSFFWYLIFALGFLRPSEEAAAILSVYKYRGKRRCGCLEFIVTRSRGVGARWGGGLA